MIESILFSQKFEELSCMKGKFIYVNEQRETGEVGSIAFLAELWNQEKLVESASNES